MSLLYSIPVHESPECIKQMCDGILYFDRDALIILHVSKSKSITDFDFLNERVIINPTQFETKWGCDLSRIHISNYLYVSNLNIFNITHIIFLTSNCLMIKNPSDFVKNYDAGFSNHPNRKIGLPPPSDIDSIKWNYDNVDIFYEPHRTHSELQNLQFKDILLELGLKKIRYTFIEGSYVNKDIMEKICHFYLKYINFKYMGFAFEEKLFPTLACSFTDNISNSLIYFINLMNWKVDYTSDIISDKKAELDKLDISSQKLDYFKSQFISNDEFFIKGVPRDISNEIRVYYDRVIKKSQKYLDFFDNVFYIIRDYSKKQIFEKLAFEQRIPINTFELDKNTYSHNQIIQFSKEKGFKNILIFEENCLLSDIFTKKAHIYTEQLKNTNWDLMYFGGEPTSKSQFVTENLAKTKDIKGNYAYAINHTYFDKILTDVGKDNANIFLGDEMIAFDDSQTEILKKKWKQFVKSNKKMI